LLKPMFIILCLFPLLLIVSHVHSSVEITSNAFSRVFLIKYKDFGTAFTIEVDQRQYLITAKHVVKGIKNKDKIKIFHDEIWKEVQVTSIACGNENTDIIVLVPPYQLSPSFELVPTMHNLVYSQDVYFLGFPYGMYTDGGDINRRFPLPFVKKGICSSIRKVDDVNVIVFIDGHNNPGFSGGPIIFKDLSTNKLNVAGVISAYRNHPDPVFKKQMKIVEGKEVVSQEETELIAISNAGIVLGYSIDPAIEEIRNNPIGPKIKEEPNK